MQTATVVYPPNRPLERLLYPSKTPVMCDYAFFLDVNLRGELIVGRSDIVGALWEGTLYHYKDVEAAQTNEYSGYYISTSSTADAKIFKTDFVALAEDTGCIKLLSLTGCGDPYIKCEELIRTNDMVEQMSTWSPPCSNIVACMDSSILIAEFTDEGAAVLQEYRNYHTDRITSVDADKKREHIFASASSDRRAAIWDIRAEDVATVIYQNEFCGCSSVAWNPLDNNYITVGTDEGVVYSLDVRQPNEVLDCFSCITNKIHRLSYNDRGYLAVCTDSATVAVLNPNKSFDVVYQSEQHLSYVRGLAWREDVLYSCGFDTQIIKHVVDPEEPSESSS